MIKYSIIDHNSRETLGLSLSEYIIADCIYQLSNNPKNTSGSCSASNEYLADWLNISVRGLQKIIRRLEEKEIITNESGNRKITDKYYKTVISGREKKKNKEVKKADPETLTNFNIIWQRYPKRIGREKGLRYYLRLIKTKEDHALLNKAITNYKLCQDVQDGMIMKFEKFIVDYKDWAEYKIN